jgi:hypothetical protein
MSELLTRFTSCGRCSLFLAAYRLNHDDDVLDTASREIDKGWLALPWDQSVRKLINKSYGCRIDVESYHFESCCPECLGQFRYTKPEPDQPAYLLVKV